MLCTVTSFKLIILETHPPNEISPSKRGFAVIQTIYRSLGLVKRTLKHAPTQMRKLAHRSFVCPKIEYTSAIWDPGEACLPHNIESLQNRAVPIIFYDYSRRSSTMSLRSRAHLESKSHRRKIEHLSLFHKLHHHSFLHDDFFQSAAAIVPRCDDSCNVKCQTCLSHCFASLFILRTILDWNNLPSYIAAETNIRKCQKLTNTEQVDRH